MPSRIIDCHKMPRRNEDSDSGQDETSDNATDSEEIASEPKPECSSKDTAVQNPFRHDDSSDVSSDSESDFDSESDCDDEAEDTKVTENAEIEEIPEDFINIGEVKTTFAKKKYNILKFENKFTGNASILK